MKILIDMNLTPNWVEVFESSGNDLDFGTLLATNEKTAPSVIQVRTQDVLPASIKDLVINSLHQFQTELKEGALITIDEARSKARVLPIN